MILRELREIDNTTDDILVYGWDGSANKKILTDTSGKLDIVNVNLDIALSDLKSVLDAINTDIDVALSTRASETTLALVKTALDAINTDLDVALSTRASEATVALIKTAVDNINSNIDVTLSTRSSESTSQEILDAIGQGSGTNLLTELQNLILDLETDGLATEVTLDLVKTAVEAINTDFDVALSTRASEATLSSIKTVIDTINSNVDVALSTRSSEATAQSILDALGEGSGTNILSELQNLITNLSDIATETTLGLIKTAIDSINANFNVALSTRASETTLGSVLTELQSIDSKDFATETTLALIKTAIDAINADLDVALSTRASEATQLLIKTALDSIDSSIDVSLSTRASQATVQAILDTLGEASGITLLSELTNLVNTDFATETTLALMKVALDAINTDIDVALSTRASESTLDLVRVAVEAIDTDLDVALSTRASESTLLDVKTNLDDVKTKLDTLNATDFATEVTSQAIFDAIGTLSGTDVINQLKCICDKLNDTIAVTFPPSSTNQTIQLVWDKDHTAPNKPEWQELLEYTVPTGWDLNAVAFDATSDVSNESARVVSKIIHGTFDSLNDTYSDSAENWTVPKFASKMYVFVTTAIGSGANDIITITYTNSLGVGGRTATVTIPKSSVVGTRLEVNLQTGDDGILDVTNVTHSALGQAGEFDIETIIELFYLTLTTQAVQYQSSAVSLGGIVILEDETVYLQYESNSQVTNNRRLSLVATLVQKET